MKKLFMLPAIVLFTSAVFAQADKKMETQPQPAAKKMSHQCYMMKDGAIMHCMGDKSEAQKTDVKLKNGTMISTKGEVTMKDGKKSMLANGQCIDLHGMIGDCEKMHASMKNPAPAPAPSPTPEKK